jgi:hypothetical protein
MTIRRGLRHAEPQGQRLQRDGVRRRALQRLARGGDQGCAQIAVVIGVGRLGERGLARHVMVYNFSLDGAVGL